MLLLMMLMLMLMTTDRTRRHREPAVGKLTQERGATGAVPSVSLVPMISGGLHGDGDGGA